MHLKRFQSEHACCRSPWPQGVGRIVLTETHSSNAAALAAEATVPMPTWFLALKQTAGRGRKGRTWYTPTGNFAASVLCKRIQKRAQTPHMYGFVAALAVFDTCWFYINQDNKQQTPHKLALKWPNDVILNNGKVAGILVECTERAVAVGIGVNLITPPPQNAVRIGGLPPAVLHNVLAHPMTTTNDSAPPPPLSPIGFLHHLAGFYQKWVNCFLTFGFHPIRQAWLERALGLGDWVSICENETTQSGIFETIDQTSGAIILNDHGQRRTICMGDLLPRCCACS